MARPRVFVSSTYYDLRHIRSSMEGFIESFGYDSVLFENGDIPFMHDITLADACYNEVKNSHMLILIVGGRYGSADEDRKEKVSSGDQQKMFDTYNSVTRKEYETARSKDIPIFIFVERGVKAEYETFKANRHNESIKYAHVDSVNIFRLLDDILFQKRNNFVKDFDKFEDITGWLREQWAGIFAELLVAKREDAVLKDLSSKIDELNQVTSSMKEYTQTILLKVQPDSKPMIDKEEEREQAARLSRFRSEPMITYMRRRATSLKNSVPSIQLFKAMRESSDYDDFIAKSKLPPLLVEEFLGEVREQATKDYVRMKRSFFSQIVDDLTDEENESEVGEKSTVLDFGADPGP